MDTTSQDKKICNVMFDLGGVIMDIRRENAVEALKKIGMTNADELLGVYGQKGAFLALEKGLISEAQFRDALRHEIDGDVTDEQIDEAFGRFLIGIPVDRLRQLDDLRARGYKIYLLSNTNPIMWHGIILDEFCKDGKTIDDYFDGIITSFDVHAYKPDPAIFARAIEKFGFSPSATIFLDDSAANCEAARNIGFQAAHVADPAVPFIDYLSK